MLKRFSCLFLLITFIVGILPQNVFAVTAEDASDYHKSVVFLDRSDGLLIVNSEKELWGYYPGENGTELKQKKLMDNVVQVGVYSYFETFFRHDDGLPFCLALTDDGVLHKLYSDICSLGGNITSQVIMDDVKSFHSEASAVFMIKNNNDLYREPSSASASNKNIVYEKVAENVKYAWADLSKSFYINYKNELYTEDSEKIETPSEHNPKLMKLEFKHFWTKIMDDVAIVKTTGGNYKTYYVVKTNGDLYTWGGQMNGELGTGYNTSKEMDRGATGRAIRRLSSDPKVPAFAEGEIVPLGSTIYEPPQKILSNIIDIFPYSRHGDPLGVYAIDSFGNTWKWGDSPVQMGKVYYIYKEWETNTSTERLSYLEYEKSVPRKISVPDDLEFLLAYNKPHNVNNEYINEIKVMTNGNIYARLSLADVKKYSASYYDENTEEGYVDYPKDYYETNADFVLIGTKGIYGQKGLNSATNSAPAVAEKTFGKQAQYSDQPIYLNSSKIDLNTYLIDGSNYCKLRDVAYALKQTDAKFDVSWSESSGGIILQTNTTYSGTTETNTNSKTENALEYNGKIFVDSKEVSISGYNINGNNYFKLRDLAQLLSFSVDWNSEGSYVAISTK